MEAIVKCILYTLAFAASAGLAFICVSFGMPGEAMAFGAVAVCVAALIGIVAAQQTDSEGNGSFIIVRGGDEPTEYREV